MSHNKKGHTIRVYCMNCRSLLYKYHKVGPGHLVKCYRDRIIEDHTDGDLRCPHCKGVFAREAMIRGQPANKIIQGKVFVRR